MASLRLAIDCSFATATLQGLAIRSQGKKEELDKHWHGDDIRGARDVDKWGLNSVPHRFGRPGFIPASPCFFPAGSCRSSRFVQRFVVASQANGRKSRGQRQLNVGIASCDWGRGSLVLAYCRPASCLFFWGWCCFFFSSSLVFSVWTSLLSVLICPGRCFALLYIALPCFALLLCACVRLPISLACPCLHLRRSVCPEVSLSLQGSVSLALLTIPSPFQFGHPTLLFRTQVNDLGRS